MGSSTAPIPLGCPWCGDTPYILTVKKEGELDRLSVQCQSEACSVRPIYTSMGIDKKPVIRAWNTRVLLEMRKDNRSQENAGLALVREIYDQAKCGILLSESLVKKIETYLGNNIHQRKPRKTNV